MVASCACRAEHAELGSGNGHDCGKQNLVAANAIIGVAKAAYFPRISVTGFLGFQSNQLSNLFTTSRTAQSSYQIHLEVIPSQSASSIFRSSIKLGSTETQYQLIGRTNGLADYSFSGFRL